MGRKESTGRSGLLLTLFGVEVLDLKTQESKQKVENIETDNYCCQDPNVSPVHPPDTETSIVGSIEIELDGCNRRMT